MKSSGPEPPPLVDGNESEVLPSPLDPIAEDEVEEPLELVDADAGLLAVVPPRRLVAAVNADVALGAALEADEVDDVLELLAVVEEVEEAVLEVVEVVSRP